MIPLLSKEDFTRLRREPLLDYDIYRAEAEDFLQRIPKAATRLADPEWLHDREPDVVPRMVEARAEYALDLLTLSYSAGVDIAILAAFMPDLLRYFEEFAHHAGAYQATQTGYVRTTPHLFLADTDFDRANRLLCFTMLLGGREDVPRVMAILDHNNARKDGLLERLAGSCMQRPPAPPTCLRGLPYARTLTIFDTPAAARPQLMHDYLSGWYKASRNEAFYGRAEGQWFYGYWSWEAAAITRVLDIDDGLYRDLPYYPRDLARYGLRT